MADRHQQSEDITNSNDFRRTDSDKASQLGPSSPSERKTDHPQAEGAASSADNDMDRQTTMQHNLQKDAEQAQSDGNLSFPEGK
jgi:hypothetical protein